MSNTTPAVVVTAQGLLACYGSTLPDESQQFAAQVERSQKLQDIADQIHSVIRDERKSYNTCGAIARQYAENDTRDYIEGHGVARFVELLVSVRGVEYGLKIVEAPEPLARLHMDRRRALAKGRSW